MTADEARRRTAQNRQAKKEGDLKDALSDIRDAVDQGRGQVTLEIDRAGEYVQAALKELGYELNHTSTTVLVSW